MRRTPARAPMRTEGGGISRRDAVLLAVAGLLGAARAARVPGAGSLPGTALAQESTSAALSDAQAQYQQVQAQIDDLAAQVADTSAQLSDTLDQMSDKQAQIDQTQADIEVTQQELAELQDQLASVISDDYKNGTASTLDVLLSSSSFEELYRNIYYLTKVNDSEAALIEQTWQTQQQLQQQQDDLNAQYQELESMRDSQQQQVADIQARQDDAYALLSGLDEQVQALTEQYNQELIVQAAAEAQAAAAAAAQAGPSYTPDYGGITGNGSLDSVLGACYSTPSPGDGLCAAWVTNVFQSAGVGYFGGNACDMFASWCYSADTSSLQPGMILAVSSHSHTTAGAIYGHIGIYVGGGTVMDNVGYIRSIGVDEWISFYGTTVTPRWGWLGGIALA